LPKILTSVTVPDVELIPDDREPHGVSAVQKLTVFDRVETEVQRDVWRPTSVPARPVPHFRLRQKTQDSEISGRNEEKSGMRSQELRRIEKN
jgi:hypothetical protein